MAGVPPVPAPTQITDAKQLPECAGETDELPNTFCQMAIEFEAITNGRGNISPPPPECPSGAVEFAVLLKKVEDDCESALDTAVSKYMTGASVRFTKPNDKLLEVAVCENVEHDQFSFSQLDLSFHGDTNILQTHRQVTQIVIVDVNTVFDTESWISQLEDTAGKIIKVKSQALAPFAGYDQLQVHGYSKGNKDFQVPSNRNQLKTECDTCLRNDIFYLESVNFEIQDHFEF